MLADERELRVMIRRGLATKLICGSCKAAAPGCCFQAVGVSLYEAVLLVLAHEGEIVGRREEIEARAELEAATYEAAGSPVVYATRWHGSRVPCLLLKDGRCSVYELAPYACATHGLAAGDSSECAPSVIGQQPTSAMLDIRDLRAELLEHVRNSSEGVSLNGHVMPARSFPGLGLALREALRWLTEIGALRDRTGRSGKGGVSA